MKVTIEVPDSTVCITYQYIFDEPSQAGLSLKQEGLDARELDKFRGEAAKNEV